MTVEIEEILTRAVEAQASDILLMGGERVAFRIHGAWHRQEEWGELRDDQVYALIASIFPSASAEELSRLKDADFSFSLSPLERFRVNVYRTQSALAAVIRPIPAEIPSLASLGYDPKTVSILQEALKKRTGLILVTGATGSGKSTTLASMIEWINGNRAVHIVTIEDPIEFFFTPKKAVISQREVGQDTDSFARALKAVLRQAPQVIMVGEMRDLETISATLTAAETGHLVLATLHTNSAAKTVDRIVDVFPEGQRDMVRLQLATNLRLVLSQVLLPRKDGQGRVLAYEVLVVTPAISSLIRRGETNQIPNRMQTGAHEGNVTMEATLRRLLEAGLIDGETAGTVMGEIRVEG